MWPSGSAAGRARLHPSRGRWRLGRSLALPVPSYSFLSQIRLDFFRGPEKLTAGIVPKDFAQTTFRQLRLIDYHQLGHSLSFGKVRNMDFDAVA
jgi:hypothetical protein